MVAGTTIKLKWGNKMIWICEYCGAEIESRRKLYKHKRDEHNIRNGSQKKYNFICEYCLRPLFLTKASFANHKRYCKENPNRQPGTFRGKKHTNASKSKISESMHNAALIGKNRGWVTSRVGDERKSYPEVFFTKVIENEFFDKDYNYNLPFFTWKLDFAWQKKKRCIEIDGSQHQRSKVQAESDQRKDSKLVSEGWKVLRIKWKDLFNNTKEKIEEAKRFIDLE